MTSRRKPSPDKRVLALAKRLASLGETPAFIFDLRAMKQRMAWIAEVAEDHGARFLFAVKSFPDPKVLRLAGKFLHGFDVANLNELKAIKSDSSRKLIWLTSPQDLKSLLKSSRPSGISIVSCESLQQLRELNAQSTQTRRFALRLNSSYLLSKTGNSEESRFGWDMDSLAREAKTIRASRHEFAGFSMHHGSEVNRWEHYLSMAQAALKLAAKLKLELEYLNLGGGLAHLSPENVAQLLKDLRSFVPKEIQLVFEPGRFWAEHAGYAVGSVSHGNRRGQIRTDLSLSCHLRWAVPQLAFLATRDAKLSSGELRLYGSTCAEGELIAESKLNQISVSRSAPEHLVLANISGYSVAWNHSFNGIPRAAVHYLL